MKKPDKKKYEEVPEEPVGEKIQNKKVEKPWDLEYMITDEAFLNQNSFFKNEKKLDVWLKDSWLNKMVSVENAIGQLNKAARSSLIPGKTLTPINHHWRFAGKKFRLVNRDTEEVVDLLFTDTEFYAK